MEARSSLALPLMYLVTVRETDNLHNNDAMSFTIFDTIFCSPSNDECHRRRHGKEEKNE